MASSSSSDNTESIRRRAANGSENGVDQETQENNPSPDPNTALSSNNVARPASPSPAVRARGRRGVLGTLSRPLFRATRIIETPAGFRVYAERDLDDDESDSSSARRGFDMSQMTVDLPPLPPRPPHPPRVSNQEAAQGGEAAAAQPGSAVRQVPIVRRFVPDLNMPPPEENGEM